MTAKTAPATTYGYDQFDRLRTATEGGQTVTYVYDGIGRHTSTTSPQGTVTFGNNWAYQRTKLTWPDGFYVDYALDWTGAVTAIKQQGGLALAAFTYDNLGRRATLTRSNGVVTTYAYDAVSRLQTLTNDLASTANDETLTFSYNAAGQIKSRTSSNAAYAWNGLYNVSKPYTANGLNQVASIGPQATTHDARGNLTSDGVTTFSYDVENRLIGASGGATLGYDPVARLNQVTSSGGTVSKFLYDGTDLIGEYDSAGTILRRYVHGPEVDEPLVWFEGTSWTADRRWLIADNQGSTVAVTNGTGASLGLLAYDEHGVPQTGGSLTPRFQYTGQAWIPEVGLYHYKTRAYSPTLGRFMQTDPIGYGDGLNMYGYVGGDPANSTDPDGLSRSGCQDPDPNVIIVCGVPPTGPAGGVAPAPAPGPGNLGNFKGVGTLVDELVVKAKRLLKKLRDEDKCPAGPYVNVSYGASGTLMTPLTAGAGGGVQVALNHPVGPPNLLRPLAGYQVSFSAQGHIFGGGPAFIGVGDQVGSGVSATSVPRGVSSSDYITVEGDAGWGRAAGFSAQANTDGSGASGALSAKRGVGYGIAAGVGRGRAYNFAPFAPIGCKK